MELRQLQHVIALAEEQNFTRAARRVNIVQSALSTSVRQLEAELGAALFVRSTRQVRLTEAGKVFLDKVRIAMAAIDGAREAVAAVRDLGRGSLSIGTLQSLPAFLDLPGLIAQFHAEHPGVEVRLVQGSSSELLAKLRNGRLDLAFLPVFEPLEDVQTRMIVCESLVLGCAPEHPLAGRRNVSLSALKDECFVVLGLDWSTRRLVDHVFREAQVERHIGFEVSDLTTLLELVQRGLGVALLPESLVRSRGGSLGKVELAEPELRWELVVAHLPDSPVTPLDHAPRAFLHLLQDEREHEATAA